jgi:hypothetical protein
MAGLRGKLTYANVVATIALFAALGGGSFAVAAALKKDSVGTKQIQKKAVKAAELDTGAVTSKKIAAAAVTSVALADGSVTGAKINESELGPVPTADEALKALNILSVVVKSDGTLDQATQENTFATRVNPGSYVVDFNRDVRDCTAVATIGNAEPGIPSGAPVPPSAPVTPVFPAPGFIGTSQANGNNDAVVVTTRNPNSPFNQEDHAFQLAVVCP